MTQAAMKVVVPPGQFEGRNVCLFVSYSPQGRVKDHVRLHIDRLRECGIAVFFIMVADDPSSSNLKQKVGFTVGLVVRKNSGFDFGAWSDTLRSFPQIWEANTLFLVNDSVFGPFGNYREVFGRVLASKADFIGLTESLQHRRHYQSYFLAFKGRSMQSSGLRQLWAEVQDLPDKKSVIERYELGLLDRCLALGLTADALFPARTSAYAPISNPTHSGWFDLVKQGYPYIKVELLRANPLHLPFLTDWRTIIADPDVIRVIDVALRRPR